MKGDDPSDDKKAFILIELEKSPYHWDWKICTSVDKPNYEGHGMESKGPDCQG